MIIRTTRFVYAGIGSIFFSYFFFVCCQQSCLIPCLQYYVDGGRWVQVGWGGWKVSSRVVYFGEGIHCGGKDMIGVAVDRCMPGSVKLVGG